VGDSVITTSAITADGSRIVFASKADELNPLGPGPDNAGQLQYYLYDDRDRSLTCVSCPPDGSPPLGDVGTAQSFGGNVDTEANVSPLADDGTFAFSTATPLLGQDQNTGSGTDLEAAGDVYEYRDGRLLLVTDGLTAWPSVGPRVFGTSPSGRDLFIAATAQYTADAIDDQLRIYDARIGGGIAFPLPPVPCPLEACQGPPSPVPTDPDSTLGGGPANSGKDRTPPTITCKKNQKLKNGKCVRKKKKHKKRRGK
jgi:hypothetical protein